MDMPPAHVIASRRGTPRRPEDVLRHGHPLSDPVLTGYYLPWGKCPDLQPQVIIQRRAHVRLRPAAKPGCGGVHDHEESPGRWRVWFGGDGPAGAGPRAAPKFG
jgi:hypothetical protein